MNHEPDIRQTVIPKLRVKDHDQSWKTETNVAAFQAACRCGWEGPKRTSHRDADDDCVTHRIYAE